MSEEHHDDETLIEHFEKCVPGGKEALDKARRELREKSPLQPRVRRRRIRKEKET